MEGADALSVVRVHRGLAGLALRHDGPAALQSGPDLGGPQPDPGAARRHDSGRPVDGYAGYTTTIFMIGWALGGFFFGVLGDRLGRAKTMMLTVLCYSAFTGLSALSVGVWDFAGYRFLTGLGVGGQFAVGVALVAEVMSDRARPFALGWLQALSAVGNMLAAIVSLVLGKLEEAGADRKRLATHVFDRAGAGLAGDPDLPASEGARALEGRGREEEVAGAGKREAGLAGRAVRRPVLAAEHDRRHGAGLRGRGRPLGHRVFQLRPGRHGLPQALPGPGLSAQEIAGKLTFWKGITSLLQNGGAFFGIYAFARMTHHIGRKPAFAISFVLAAAATAMTFWFLDTFWQIFVLIPIMGFCQLALFGGYAIYFPELFPTRLRSTGTSFCYNVGRLVAAAGPSVKGLLTSRVFGGYPEPMRYAGITMCSVFLVGLLALPFAPETRGKPLPE